MEEVIRMTREIESGLKKKFVRVLGGLIEDIVGYSPASGLSEKSLINSIETDSEKINSDISAGKVDGGTMLLIRSNMIASALIGDIKGTEYWAEMGAKYCGQVEGGGWNQTRDEFELVMNNPEEFSELSRIIKRI